MEKAWKPPSLYLGFILCEVCDGLPINFENSITDFEPQILTGFVALLLAVCSILLGVGCMCCQRRNGFKIFRDSPVVASVASNLDNGHTNPVANGEFTIFAPLSPRLQNNNVFLASQTVITRTEEDYVYGDVDVSSWFNGSDTDFPRIKLKYIKEIGKGWFGRVVEGAAQDAEDEKKWTPVVVRILDATASSKERVVFLHDAAIYRCGNHENILKLHGRCLDTIPLLLLQEYCSQGDLKNYLRQNKSTSETFLASEYPLLWSCQLASALKHIHEHKLIHPDLAARNCQITSDLILKLGDYGLAVFQYPEDYYLGAPGVSVRWCAPETVSSTSTTIEPKKVTFEANIWSFAVVMWEIFECGEQPYSVLSDDEVVSLVLGSQKVRLNKPKYQTVYSDYIYCLMQQCWSSSESRPVAAQVDLMLQELYKSSRLHSDQNVSMEDFDKRWMIFKPNNIVKTDNHLADNNEVKVEDTQIDSNYLSSNFNNLHGSLNNLLMESLENVTDSKSLSEPESSHCQNLTSESNIPKLEFKLGPCVSKQQNYDFSSQNDSLDSSLLAQRTSSGSETEEENWKKKIERGAYTEKVRQKSRSVADLMVLTHIDPSESESETPLPSLDYRINYKNVRYASKQNMENSNFIFGSEGNLLNVQDTFEEELRKLKEERKDSLLFVPENSSQIYSNSHTSKQNDLEQSHNTNILQELSSSSEIKPANQVFNVFNVTVHNYSSIQPETLKLNEIINFKEDKEKSVPKLVDIIRSNSDLTNYISLRNGTKENSTNDAEGEEQKSVDFCESKPLNIISTMKESIRFSVPTLVDLIQNNNHLMDHMLKYKTVNIDNNSLDSAVCSEDGNIPFKQQPNENFEKVTNTTLCQSTEQDSFSSLDSNEKSDANSDFSENIDNQNLSEMTENQELNKIYENQKVNEIPENQKVDVVPKSINSQNEENFVDVDDISTMDVCETKDSDDFVVNENIDEKFDINTDLSQNNNLWDANGTIGWFLHPQSNADVSDEITTSNVDVNSYVGFNVDDEVMAAVRTELINKLPQAQSCTSGNVHDEEEWDSTERDELFLRYNVYNTPLSPIPEESVIDDSSYVVTREHNCEIDESDWSDHCERGSFEQDLEDESHSVHTLGSSLQHPELFHRHTPSQDSCCSNDTLFNLEELSCINDSEKDISLTPINNQETYSQDTVDSSLITTTINNNPNGESLKNTELVDDGKVKMNDKYFLTMFLINEREHDCQNTEKANPENPELQLNQPEEKMISEVTDQLLPFINKPVAPLPSPEDKPWKQLPASLLSYDKLISQNGLIPNDEANTVGSKNDSDVMNDDKTEKLCVDVPEINNCNLNNSDEQGHENIIEKNRYENSDAFNEVDYVNIVNMENTKNSLDFMNKQFSDINEDLTDDGSPDYVNKFIQHNAIIIGNESDDNSMLGVLTDIRFSGPSDNQLMSTSFSESNDINDDQDWDSASDTRSSSSGEFIWKEGEHEESLKALSAGPQDMLENVHSMENITEETIGHSSSSSDDDDDDEDDDDDIESPEFIPSAWDKYATPTKSALRSPEKTLEKTEKKKSKGVWFKKQKYHCVYEYPREPESPVLHSYDLWKSQQNCSTFIDWDLDAVESSVPLEGSDSYQFPNQNLYLPNTHTNKNMYHLNDVDFPSRELGMDDEFFISSSARPFDMITNFNSQFFPGDWTDLNKMNDNATPDSGVEDNTPGGLHDSKYTKIIPTLKQLASEAIKKSKEFEDLKQNDVLGGLRHTRNKLKLDLPPSPSAFTSNKLFSVESTIDPVITREKPTFTTFGKSRFLVQHVDTPPDNDTNKNKNVSFEALPHKLIQTHIIKDEYGLDKNRGNVEMVRGEASLLDSADEDSGIESSTLERKFNSLV